MTITQQGIITLLRSAITGEKLPLPEGFDLGEADKLIRSQSLLPLVFQGAYSCGMDMDAPLLAQYRTDYFRCLLRSQRQLAAVREIFRAFEERGIDYLPLKGCVMKPLYPNPEMRVMGDADILIRMEQYETIRTVMESLGYEERGESYHEWVWTGPALYLELHKCLFAQVERDFYPVFGDGWAGAIRQEGHCYALSPEVTYLYLFTHMAKHYRGSGIGARQLVDLYVYRRAHPELDGAEVERLLRRLNLTEFHENTLAMLDHWFGEGQEREATRLMTDYILSGGNWGDLQTRFVSDQLRSGRKRNVRLAGLWRAVFPPLEQMRYAYGILFRHPWLCPFLWPVRWVQGVFTRPGEILEKFRILGRMDDKKLDARRQMLNAVGLEFE